MRRGPDDFGGRSPYGVGGLVAGGPPPQTAARARTSALQLVDLAGSERRQAVGEYQGFEGSAINKSLLSLSTIIHRLADLSAAGQIVFTDLGSDYMEDWQGALRTNPAYLLP